MSRAKRHHYVPQAHQRLFGVGLRSNRIWVYEKRTDRIDLRSIKDTAVIGNYYTVATPQGPSDELERALAGIESDALPVLGRLCAAAGPRFDLDLTSRFQLSAYLGALYTRVPAARLGVQQMAEHLATITLDMNLRPDGWAKRARKAGMKGTDAELEAHRAETLADLRSGSLRVKAPEGMSLSGIATGLTAIAELIASMGWVLLKRSSFPGYIIGDAPVSLWPSQNHPKFRGAGFATEDAEVSVPLDPHNVLIMSHQYGMLDGCVVDEQKLPGTEWLDPWPYQYRTWARAHRFVFGASRADLEAIQFMLTPEERRRSYSGIRVLGGPPEWQAYATRSSSSVRDEGDAA